MIDYTLEEKIKTLSTQYIEHKTVTSFLLLLIDLLEREKETQAPISYEIHHDILDLQNKVKQYTLELESILDGKEETRLAALEDCINLKKKLVSIYENIYQYISLCGLHFTRMTDEIFIRKHRGKTFEDINWEAFYMDCTDFLEVEDDIFEQKTRIADLLKCLPFQMARAKYYDIIKKNLYYYFSQEPEQVIKRSLEIFSHFFIPEKNENFEKYFTDLGKWIFSRKNVIPSELSDEALEQERIDFHNVTDNLENIEDMFHSIFHNINSLISIFYIGYSFSELTEKDVSYSDLYHTVCEMLTGELSETEKEAYLEQVTTSLENAVEKLIDKGNVISVKEINYLKKVNDFSELSEDTNKILLTEDFIRDCYFSMLNEELFQLDTEKNLPPASQEWKEKAFDDFISNIRESFSSMPVPVRKAAMQQFLGTLPSTFTVEEVLSMIEQAIESANTFEQKILIVDKIGTIFESYGFNEDDDEYCDCGHDHHHHDHCDHHH